MNDSFLWYNVPGWESYGLAVPNWSDDVASQNESIRDLVQTMGRNVQAIMWHADTRLRTPPSINTLMRVHKLCVRMRQLLGGRAIAPGTPNMEPAHTVPAPEVFLVYPTPYFEVRNTWLKRYAGLILQAISEAMQHTENARPLEISTTFAQVIGQYVTRVDRMMATELLMIPLEEVQQPDFSLSDEQLRAYDPSKWFTSTELIDTVPNLLNWPTEDQLQPITNGIPVTRLGQLPRWPNTSLQSSGGTGSTTSTSSPSGSWFGPVSP